MRRLRASQSNARQTLPSWNCSARPLLFLRLILTPLTRTRDSSTILTRVLLRLITCHIPARTPTIPAFQSLPFQRALCLTTPHPSPRPRRPHRREMTNPHPQLAAMSPTCLLRRLLGSSRAGTSLPVVTEPLASLPTLRVRIIPVRRRLLSIPLPMSSCLTLPTFITSLRHRPSFNHRMAYPLPTICPPSPHNQQRSQSHHHPRLSSCTSVTVRRLCLPYRSPSTLREHPYQRQDLTAPCPLSHPLTPTPANILSHFLYPLPWRIPRQGRSRLLRRSRNPRLRPSHTNATPPHLNKMVYKNRFHKKALVNVVIVAQVVVQVSAVRHLVAVAGRRAYSSRPAAAEMGTYSECRRPRSF